MITASLLREFSIEIKNAKKCSRPVITRGGVYAL